MINKFFYLSLLSISILSFQCYSAASFSDNEEVGNNSSLNSHLFISALCGNFDEAEQAIIAGADVNTTDSEGNTSLMAAAQGCHYDIVELLLRHGANVNAINSYNFSALYEAVYANNIAIVKLLFSAGANLDHLALRLACGSNKMEIVNLFISVHHTRALFAKKPRA